MSLLQSCSGHRELHLLNLRTMTTDPGRMKSGFGLEMVYGSMSPQELHDDTSGNVRILSSLNMQKTFSKFAIPLPFYF